MPDPSSIFLSQAETEVASELDRLIDAATRGSLRTFNTGRAGRGLSAGDRIDPTLLVHLRSADAMISLWSPAALDHPAWMAWELGAAVALDKRVYVACVLGVDPVELPLHIGHRFAPDLGNADATIDFLRDICEDLDVPLDLQAARNAYDEWEVRGLPNPLRATIRTGAASLRLIVSQNYLLVESTFDEEINDLRVVPAPSGDLMEELISQIGSIEGRGRRVIALSVEAQSLIHAKDSTLIEWLRVGHGRECQRIAVTSPPAY
jgi:hypothetical protein